MNFRKATDALCEPLTHEQLADALGVSVATVRQARLNPIASAHRSPPDGWQAVVLKLAERRAAHYRRLANKLRAKQNKR